MPSDSPAPDDRRAEPPDMRRGLQNLQVEVISPTVLLDGKPVAEPIVRAPVEPGCVGMAPESPRPPATLPITETNRPGDEAIPNLAGNRRDKGMADTLFDPRESRGRPGPFIPESAYRSADELLAESRKRQDEWREICDAAQRRLSLACRGPGRIPDEAYTALGKLLTAARRAGETDLLFGVLFRYVPIASHADLAAWCRAQHHALLLYESHNEAPNGREAYHVLIRRPGETVELSEFDVLRLAIPLMREYDDVATIAEKIGPIEARMGQGPRIKTPPHVGDEPLRGVVHFAWHLMRNMPGVDRPAEPESVPDAPAARRAFDAVIRWCEKQAPPVPAPATHGCVYLGDGKLRVGDRPILLEAAQGNVLEALIELRQASLPELKDKSGHRYPSRILQGIREQYPELAPYIRLPGKRGGGGYSTSIKIAPPAD